MEVELILVSFIICSFLMATVELVNHNWFKRETFKLRKDFTKRKFLFDLKKEEKALGFTSKTGGSSKEIALPGNLGGLTNLLPLLNKLEPEQLSDLIATFTGGESESGGGIIETILEKIPPETIQSFLQGINKGKSENTNDEIVYES